MLVTGLSGARPCTECRLRGSGVRPCGSSTTPLATPARPRGGCSTSAPSACVFRITPRPSFAELGEPTMSTTLILPEGLNTGEVPQPPDGGGDQATARARDRCDPGWGQLRINPQQRCRFVGIPAAGHPRWPRRRTLRVPRSQTQLRYNDLLFFAHMSTRSHLVTAAHAPVHTHSGFFQAGAACPGVA